MRSISLLSVECCDAVCPGFYFGEDGVVLVGADFETLSGEVEVVEFSGGVVDVDADAPCVFGGVLDGVGSFTVEGGKVGVSNDPGDGGVDDCPGRGGDGDAADGFSVGRFDELNDCPVALGGDFDACSGFSGGLVVGGAKGICVTGEGGDDGVVGVCGYDGCGKGADCGLYGAGRDEVGCHYCIFPRKGSGWYCILLLGCSPFSDYSVGREGGIVCSFCPAGWGRLLRGVGKKVCSDETCTVVTLWVSFCDFSNVLVVLKMVSGNLWADEVG